MSEETTKEITKLISTIISSVGTVYFSKNSTNKEIYKTSLEKVYIPLMKIFDACEKELIGYKYNPIDAQEKISAIINKEKDFIKNLINDNYELFSSGLPVKLESLLEDAQYNLILEKDIKNIIYLIKTDYEAAKTKCGYPYTSLSYCFFKEDFRGKAHIAHKVVYKFANICLIFLLISTSILTAFSFTLKNIILCIVVLIIIAVLYQLVIIQ